MRSALTILTVAVLSSGTVAQAADVAFPTREKLGEALFFDVNLSKNRTQSCSTCHMPDIGFSDRQGAIAGNAVSVGDDGKSVGDRNAPSAAYAALTPPFHKDVNGAYLGGQFWDGRASSLEDQAAGPPLNPGEMGMPDAKAVAERLKENPDYVAAFSALFGADVLKDPNQAFRATTEAIAAFERTPEFAPFDSRYDRYLKGEVKFTEQEELGRTLFFSTQFTNCNLCHDVKGAGGKFETSTFSSHKYFNIGVPANAAIRATNGTSSGFVDAGLAANPLVNGNPMERGKFKVPGLRNVAVTGPYMHNGVFGDLRTVILFYNKYNSKKKSRQINPETGQRWADAEISDNLARKELETGPGLDDKRVDALVAFLKTLTDKRYEHLLDK
ncbi:methylamine utilization protein MauG [Rhizobium sp. KVB221]|uniref:Methylamine utilization protein MauG n=1 Tax=Rhizobium setariae TaxID=2801340 RepID=A0A936YQX8_9HYPH|nr:cytochrome c peroxidase [Rhizobium setariae]MBL0370932.1 methylamine utilization protein MauG [Rhizobium setariae]